MITLTFDERYVEPILDERKDCTIRYPPSTYYAGQRCRFVTESGDEPFATATIDVVSKTTIANAPNALDIIDGSYPDRKPAELLLRLKNHYPEAGLTLFSEVAVIKFDLDGPNRAPDLPQDTRGERR